MSFENSQLGEVVSPNVLEQREKSSAAFMEMAGMKYEHGRGLIRSEEDRERHNLVMEEWQSLYRMGWETATVVNCLSWPLELHTNYGFFTVPAPNKKKGEMVHTYTIKVPSISMRDLGDGKYIPLTIHPVTIAQEFAHKYKAEGGVFWFRGDNAPAEMGELLAGAHERMQAWMLQQYMDGQANWSRFNKNPRHISDRMRDASKFLYEKGVIAELPEWVNLTREEGTTAECPHCAEIVRRGAKVCKHCHLEIKAGYLEALKRIDETEIAPAPPEQKVDMHKHKEKK